MLPPLTHRHHGTQLSVCILGQVQLLHAVHAQAHSDIMRARGIEPVAAGMHRAGNIPAPWRELLYRQSNSLCVYVCVRVCMWETALCREISAWRPSTTSRTCSAAWRPSSQRSTRTRPSSRARIFTARTPSTSCPTEAPRDLSSSSGWWRFVRCSPACAVSSHSPRCCLAGGERRGLQAGLSRLQGAHPGHDERSRGRQALRHRGIATAHSESTGVGLRRADFWIRSVREVRLPFIW